VWVAPVALVLWERSRWAGGAWVALFLARPIVWPAYGKNREYDWGPVDHLIGNAYLLAALALCAWAAISLAGRVRSQEVEQPLGA
jgi:alpha-1,2-mannosyltransferase